MKTLVVSTNRNKNPMPVLPMGACMVAQAAKNAGHETRMLDMMFLEPGLGPLEKELDSFEPEIVGLSVRNIDNNDMANPVGYIDEIAAIVELIKKRSSAAVVLGGPAIGIMPEEIVRATKADYAVVGPGEEVFPKFLNAVETYENLAYDVRVYPHAAKRYQETPDLKRWINVNAYIKNMCTAPVQTKRGCPYKCVYCTYPIIEGNAYRLFDPDGIMDSIKSLVMQGFKDIEFVDNVFNSPYEHALQLCRKITDAKLNVSFQTMELNPRFTDDGLLSAMENAGFKGMGITAESASESILESLGKDYTRADLVKAAKAVSRHNLPCFWMFMLGGPGETEQTVNETLDFAKRYIRKSDVVFFNTGIRIYPGTGLEKIARIEGVLNLSAQQMLKPVFYVSTRIEAEHIEKMVNDSICGRYNFINSKHINLPYLNYIYNAAHVLGVKPPLWRHTPKLRYGMGLLGLNT